MQNKNKPNQTKKKKNYRHKQEKFDQSKQTDKKRCLEFWDASFWTMQ